MFSMSKIQSDRKFDSEVTMITEYVPIAEAQYTHSSLSLSIQRALLAWEYIFFYFFISPLFNQVGQLRTSSHLQQKPGQDKAKQCYTNNTELHMR